MHFTRGLHGAMAYTVLAHLKFYSTPVRSSTGVCAENRR